MVAQITENRRRAANSFFYSPSNNIMPTVLITEDDADNRELLRILLEMWNFRVIEAIDGEEALNLAKKARPDLILMDVKLPLLDGIETTRKIRDSAIISDTPIIFVTGCAEAKYRNAAAEVGATAYLVKPFDFDYLQEVINDNINFSQNF